MTEKGISFWAKNDQHRHKLYYQPSQIVVGHKPGKPLKYFKAFFGFWLFLLKTYLTVFTNDAFINTSDFRGLKNISLTSY